MSNIMHECITNTVLNYTNYIITLYLGMIEFQIRNWSYSHAQCNHMCWNLRTRVTQQNGNTDSGSIGLGIQPCMQHNWTRLLRCNPSICFLLRAHIPILHHDHLQKINKLVYSYIVDIVCIGFIHV